MIETTRHRASELSQTPAIESTLKELDKSYDIIQGDHQARLRTAITIIDRLIGSDPVKEREV